VSRCKICYRVIFYVVLCVNSVSMNYAGAAESSDDIGDNANENETGVLQWNASVGLGYNSNIYQAPSDAYIDYAPATPVPVDPVTHSGFFVPLDLEADYQYGLDGNNNLLTSYQFSGEFYVDQDFRNADVSSHTIKFGDAYVLNNKGRLTESVYGGLILVKKEDEYTERDTGLDKFTTGGVNISDRYKYTATGIELKYDNRISKVKYDIKFKVLNRDFEDAVAISQLDHKYTLIGGDVKFPVAKSSKIKLSYDHYIYDYDERPSRNADGRAFASNPPLKYVYDKFLISYIYTVNRQLRTFFDYSYTTRSDEFVGYNDYKRNKIKIRALYDYSDKVDLKATFTYWDREYPNAYAFDRFVAGVNEDAKSYDGTKWELEGKYKTSEHQNYWMDFQWYNENSTDLRYQYDRMKIMIGASWEY